jgi:thioesterase domain-containing protein
LARSLAQAAGVTVCVCWLVSVGRRVSTSFRYAAPRTETERQLIAIWEAVLKRSPIGIRDNFFDLGGHPLLAVNLFGKIEAAFGVKLPLATLFTKGTVGLLAGELEAVGKREQHWSSLVTIQTGGTKPPLFCIHGAGGNVLLYRELARCLGPARPVFGFQSRGLDGRSRPLSSIEEMAEAYVAELKAAHPRGPYHLAGYCLGGMVAFEMARRLHAMGETPALVALLDTYNPAAAKPASRFSALLQRARFHAGNLAHLGPRQLGRYLREKLRVARDGELSNLLGRGTAPSPGSRPRTTGWGEDPGGNVRIQQLNDQAVGAYRPRPYEGAIIVYKPRVNYDFFPDPQLGWGGLAQAGVEVVELPVNPHAMLVEPFVEHLGAALNSLLSPR